MMKAQTVLRFWVRDRSRDPLFMAMETAALVCNLLLLNSKHLEFE